MKKIRDFYHAMAEKVFALNIFFKMGSHFYIYFPLPDKTFNKVYQFERYRSEFCSEFVFVAPEAVFLFPATPTTAAKSTEFLTIRAIERSKS